MLAELYVLTGREAGKGITASPGVPTIFVGRAATNHIRVRDPQASRVHFRVDVTADGLVLRDNNSGNGTFVNGERVEGSRELLDHDEIQLGGTRIRVLIEGPEERARWERGATSDAGALDDSLADGSQVSGDGGALDAAGRDPEPGEADDEATPDDDDGDDDGEDDGDRAPDDGDPGEAPGGDDPPAPEAAAPRRALREVLPGYRIEARLGGRSRAGVAVYRAQQASLDRPVALKVLLARGPGSQRDVERFVREAKAIARLPHPNIVTIHDVLTRGALRVIVMEYLAGGSLGDVLEGGPLGVDATLRVGEAVACALAYAHAHEVVHRNVKPSNVLFAPGAEAPERGGRDAYKLADFGLATGPGQARAGDTSFIDLPLEGLAFVPPELLEERPDADPRSDVYALGATLYACAAGAPPFTGRTAVEVATRVLRDDPAPLAQAAAPLWPLVRQAMAKDPAERQADGAALLRDVRACQAALAAERARARGRP
ncbi:MAG: protein kinase [Planctomycetes bacterium]|nr:protein kinase [Planctomycetota bacterium]